LAERLGRILKMPDEKAGLHPGGGKMMTKQHMKRDTDIKVIIDRYRQTGALPYVPDKPPMYGDFSKSLTLHEAMELTRNATAEFMKLPAAIRAAARNNPAVYLEMVADTQGREALMKAGLKLDLADAAPATPVAEAVEGS